MDRRRTSRIAGDSATHRIDVDNTLVRSAGTRTLPVPSMGNHEQALAGFQGGAVLLGFGWNRLRPRDRARTWYIAVSCWIHFHTSHCSLPHH
jgi:hypothetical protein